MDELGRSNNKTNLSEMMRSPPQFLPGDRPTNLRLAFIGDSISRYQYVSLIHFLHTGHWIDESMDVSLMDEKLFPAGWTDYFEHLSQYFDAPNNFLCDCYRGKFHQWKRNLGENMFYRDQCRGNYLTYVAKFGKFPFRGHWSPQAIPFDSTNGLSAVPSDTMAVHRTPYNVTEVSSPYTWQLPSWNETIRNYIAQLHPKPDYLVFNSGLWEGHGLDSETTINDIRNALESEGIIGIYKTTTARAAGNETALLEHEKMACQSIKHCIYLNWTGDLGHEHYTDHTHFKTYVNTRFNELLLRLVQKIES
jgi:hypothetical protein